MNRVIETDVLIIGSGLAGLLSAIKLLEAGAAVVLVCKSHLSDSNTSYAQGGIAAPIDTNAEAIKSQLQDTIKAGAGLVETRVAKEIISDGWQLIESLKNYGVLFDCFDNGNYSLAKEGGHSTARIHHYQDITGKSISSGLLNSLKKWQSSVQEKKQLQIFEYKIACSLIMSEGVCCGATFIENEVNKLDSIIQREINTVLASHIILATGGIGQVFSRTTNPAIATGDGIALAYQAGAALIDMEFMQFHPTALHLENAVESSAFLISEAVRGAGAILLDKNKDRFMPRFHPAGELATRDIIARAIYQVMQETKQDSVFIDLRPVGKKNLEEKFPNIVHRLSDYGIDAFKEPVPVSPAAHYFMGGIKTEVNGRTSIPDLYAIGECASTGLHGANRLASNSLLEAGVMALKVAQFINEQRNNSVATKTKITGEPSFMPSYIKPVRISALRKCMTNELGIMRSVKSIERAINFFKDSMATDNYSGDNIQSANILLIATLIAACALRREESRGSHFRLDYPEPRSKFACRQIICKDNYS